MIRYAGPERTPATQVFLAARRDQAMFPLASLHDHALRIWLLGPSVIVLTRAGTLLPCLDGTPDRSSLAIARDGQAVAANRDEPGFALDLADLAHPDRTLRPFMVADLPLAIDRREANLNEVTGGSGSKARNRAAADIVSCLAKDSHHLLLHGDPVALTGSDARLLGIVQFGGVFSPPRLARRGCARSAVAPHLAEACARGNTRSVLFAAFDAAARACRAGGFRPTQPCTLSLVASPARCAA